MFTRQPGGGWRKTLGSVTSMTNTEFHTLPWIVTLAFGLPMLAVVAWKRWPQAQATFLWRFVLCAITACVIAPAVVTEDFGGVATVDVFPAVMALLCAPVGAFRGEHGALAEGAGYGLFPILLVSLALVGVWSLLAKSRKVGTE